MWGEGELYVSTRKQWGEEIVIYYAVMIAAW